MISPFLYGFSPPPNLSQLFATPPPPPKREDDAFDDPNAPDKHEIYLACLHTASFLPGCHSAPYSKHHQQIFENVWRASTSLLDSAKIPTAPTLKIDKDNATKAFEWLKTESHLQSVPGLSNIRLAMLDLPVVKYYPKGLIGPDSFLGFTLLHCCCWGYIASVEGSLLSGNADKKTSSELLLNFLLNDCECNPWSIDVLGRTPLHIAASRNWTFGIKILKDAMSTWSRKKNTNALPSGLPSGDNAPLDLRGWSPVWYTNLYSKQGQDRCKARNIGTSRMDHRVLLDEANHTPDSTANVSPHQSRLISMDWIQQQQEQQQSPFTNKLPDTAGALRTHPHGGIQRSEKKKNYYSAYSERKRKTHQLKPASTPHSRRKLFNSGKNHFTPDSPSILSREQKAPTPSAPSTPSTPSTLSTLSTPRIHSTPLVPSPASASSLSPAPTTNSMISLYAKEIHRTIGNSTPQSRQTMEQHTATPPATGLVVSEHHGARMGGRERFEDAHVMADISTSLKVYAIFDGHGGDWSSNFCAEWYVQTLIEGNIKHVLNQNNTENGGNTDEQHDQQVAQCLTNVCIQLDLKLREYSPPWDQSGCTGLIVLLTPDKIYTCNVGDCRAVLVSSGPAFDLSCDFSAPFLWYHSQTATKNNDHDNDHDNHGNNRLKTKCQNEINRIKKAGGKVYLDRKSQSARIKGNAGVSLEPSRGFGDLKQKSNDPTKVAGIVSCLPEISIVRRGVVDECLLVIACDGVWDQMSSVEVASLVRACLDDETKQQNSSLDACEQLLDACLSKVYAQEKNHWVKGWLMNGKVDVHMVNENNAPTCIERGLSLDRVRLCQRDDTEQDNGNGTLNGDCLDQHVIDQFVFDTNDKLWVEVLYQRKVGSCDNMSAIVVQLQHPSATTTQDDNDDNDDTPPGEEKNKETHHSKPRNKEAIVSNTGNNHRGRWFDFANDNLIAPSEVAPCAATAKMVGMANDKVEQQFETTLEKSVEDKFYEEIQLLMQRDTNVDVYKQGNLSSKTFMNDLQQFVRYYKEQVLSTRRTEARSRKRTQSRDTQTRAAPTESNHCKLIGAHVAVLLLCCAVAVLGFMVGKHEDSWADDWKTYVKNSPIVMMSVTVAMLSAMYLNNM